MQFLRPDNPDEHTIYPDIRIHPCRQSRQSHRFQRQQPYDAPGRIDSTPASRPFPSPTHPIASACNLSRLHCGRFDKTIPPAVHSQKQDISEFPFFVVRQTLPCIRRCQSGRADTVPFSAASSFAMDCAQAYCCMNSPWKALRAPALPALKSNRSQSNSSVSK